MLIIPAIDIQEGKCVRLRQGLKDQATIYGDDPVAMGLRWQSAGARLLHVVDLDGAFSKNPVNFDVIARLRKALDIPIQLGGGIRTLETLRAYFDLGLDRLILGTVILKDRDLLTRALADFPGRVAVALDARDGKLAAEGWTETSEVEAVTLAAALAELRPAAFIYTDISRDGMQTGPNLEATRRLARAVQVPVIASGGVSTLQDIANLLPLAADGVVGVITGRALYAGSLDFQEAQRLAGDQPPASPAP